MQSAGVQVRRGSVATGHITNHVHEPTAGGFISDHCVPGGWAEYWFECHTCMSPGPWATELCNEHPSHGLKQISWAADDGYRWNIIEFARWRDGQRSEVMIEVWIANFI